MTSQKGKVKVSDPEGVAALNDIDKFEKRNAKKANRYPRDSYDTHENLDATMKQRVQLRTQITQSNIEKGLSKYSKRKLAQNFKSVRMNMKALDVSGASIKTRDEQTMS